MKTLLTLFLLLLAVATGEAEVSMSLDEPPSHFIMTHQQLTELADVMKRDYQAELRVKLIDDPCLAKMEAAMRAMDPFMPHDHSEFVDQMIFKNPELFKAASKQWETAKRECFRNAD